MEMTTTTAKTVKAVNYTADQTAELVNLYAGGKGMDTADLAEKFGRTVKSIVAKLVREKVYVKKAYVTKTGEAVAKKDATADAIGAILKLSENDTSSLAKANKTALNAVFKALSESVSTAEADETMADETANPNDVNENTESGE